jgi:MFS family permease
LAIAAVLIAPETSSCSGRIGFQRLTIPTEAQAVFAVAATAAFAGFAVSGLYTALTPSFISDVVGIENHLIAGTVAASVFLSSAAAQLLAGRIGSRAVAIGCAGLVLGAAIIAGALHFASLAGLIAGGLVAGVGQGLSFGPGLTMVIEQTPADRRAEVSSTYFVVAYVAISLPVIGAGLAATVWGLRTAGIVFASAVAALSALCLAAVLVQQARNDSR